MNRIFLSAARLKDVTKKEQFILYVIAGLLIALVSPIVARLDLFLTFSVAVIWTIAFGWLSRDILGNKRSSSIFNILFIILFLFLTLTSFSTAVTTKASFYFDKGISTIDLIIGGVALAAALLSLNADNSLAISKNYKNWFLRYRFEIMLAGLMLVGLILRILFMKANFYEDEFWHIETAIGYLKTGKFAAWNFVTDSVGKYYYRALPITLQVAGVFKVFGYSEKVARIVPLFWWILLVPVSYVFGYYFTRSKQISFALASLLIFDPIFFLASTYVRMYSMFCVVFLLFILFAYKAVEEPKTRYIIPALVLLITSFFVHIISLVSILGIVIYVVYRFVQEYRQNGKLINRFSTILIAIAAGSLIFLVANFVLVKFMGVDDFLLLRFIKLNANLIYISLALDVFPIVPAAVLFIIGIIAGIKNKKTIFLGSVVLSSLYFFSFWSDRYAGKLYIINILPIFYLLVLIGVHTVWHRRKSGKILAPIFILTAFSSLLIWQINYALTKDYLRPNYGEAYEYAGKYAGDKNMSIIFLDPKTYYLKDIRYLNKGDYITMPNKKEMSLPYFIKILNKKPKAVVVWQSRKAFHFLPEVKDYMDKNLVLQRQISNKTGFNIYKYDN